MKKIKLLTICLIVSLCTLCLSQGVLNAQIMPNVEKVNFKEAKVISNYLNIRQGPSRNSPIACVVKKGTILKVFGKVGDWYAVFEPGRNCVGAVAGYLIAPINENSPQNKIKIVPFSPPVNTGAKTKPKPTVILPKPTVILPKPTKKPTVKPTQVPVKTAIPTPTATAVSDLTQDEKDLLILVNKARQDAGVGKLEFDMDLVKVARLKAKDMVDNNYFSHQSPTYGSPFDMMRQFNIKFNSAGENIAGNQTVSGAFDAWMKSEGHKKNILNSGFNYTGIGIANNTTYGKILVQQFIGR